MKGSLLRQFAQLPPRAAPPCSGGSKGADWRRWPGSWPLSASRTTAGLSCYASLMAVPFGSAWTGGAKVLGPPLFRRGLPTLSPGRDGPPLGCGLDGLSGGTGGIHVPPRRRRDQGGTSCLRPDILRSEESGPALFRSPATGLLLQTRNACGEPVAVVPAAPDAGPGYHTGPCLIDFINACRDDSLAPLRGDATSREDR